jgi:hypothetical protein
MKTLVTIIALAALAGAIVFSLRRSGASAALSKTAAAHRHAAPNGIARTATADSPAVAPPSAPVAAFPPTAAGDSAVPNAVNPLEGIADRDERLRALRAWASRDFPAALAWASAQPEGDDRRDALIAVCFGVGEKDPARGVQTAMTYGPGVLGPGVMENLIQQWAAADLRSAYAWASNQPAGDQRASLLARIAFIWAQTAPAEAAQMVVTQLPAGGTQTEAVMTVLHQWALRDPAAALEWVRSFPETPLRTRAISELEGIMAPGGTPGM